MELRDYQQNCIESVLSALKSGITRQLVCLPTGTGKTVVFANLLKNFKRTLVIAHRIELIDQAKAKIQIWNPHKRVVVFGKENIKDADVVISTIQLASANGRPEVLANCGFDLLIIDEAHHAAADTYGRVIEAIFIGKACECTEQVESEWNTNGCTLVGFTATSERGDGAGLKSCFDSITYSKTIPEMIGSGVLCPLTGYVVKTDVDISDLRKSGFAGDDIEDGEFFNLKKLQARLNTKARNGLIYRTFCEKLSERKKVLAFCVDVQHAKDLSDYFISHGVTAAYIDCYMDANTRHKTLDDFGSGKIRVLTNFGILTEGYDEPAIDAIMVCRPVTSKSTYTQMAGRGTRKHPLKEDCVIIDFTDKTHDKLVTLQSLSGRYVESQWSKDGEQDEKLVGSKLPEINMQIDFEKSMVSYKPIDFGSMKPTYEKNDTWKQNPCSAAQDKMLRWLYPFRKFAPGSISSGQASDLIYNAKSPKAVRDNLDKLNIPYDKDICFGLAQDLMNVKQKATQNQINILIKMGQEKFVDLSNLTAKQAHLLICNPIK